MTVGGARGLASRTARLRVIVALNVVAIALAVALLALLLTRPLGGSSAGTVILDEDALQREAASAGLPESNPAPGFAPGGAGDGLRLTDLDGRAVDLADLRGRPVWITFWATYCEACRKEEPEMQRAYSAYGDEVVMLAIDIGEDPDVVRRYVADRGLPWRIAIDDGSAVDAYGAIGTPTHYFIDRDGIIRSRAFGALTYAEMEAYLATIR